MMTPWLAAHENKSPVESTHFGGEDAIETMKAVEYLGAVHKSTPS
jgi:hypothetical protein